MSFVTVALLWGALLVPSPPAVPPVPAQWPLAGGAEVVHRFDPPAQPWLPGHRGVDLQASPGQPVRAPISGVVEVARTVVDRGVVVIVGRGLRVSLEPVAADVAPGQFVAAGAVIGTVGEGPSHCRSRCLHWGLRKDGAYHDPLLLVVAYRAVLLP